MKRIFAILAATLPAVACAHPMGNFTINHCSRLTAGAAALRLRFTLDMAELPTITERQDMDKDGDGQPSPAETAAYLADRVPKWLAKLKVSANGAPLAWKLEGSRLVFTPGVANLATMRVEVSAAAPWSPGVKTIAFEDGAYPERPGWKEIVVAAAPGFPRPIGADGYVDRSHELRRYPENLVQTPPQESSVTFTVTVPAAKREKAAHRALPATVAPAASEKRAPAPLAVKPAAKAPAKQPPARPAPKAPARRQPALVRPAQRLPAPPRAAPARSAPVPPPPARVDAPSPARRAAPPLAAAAVLLGLSLYLRRARKPVSR
ncbi:MAG TPA: hypothetical protein VGM37_00885 [Armatimonadota bacterium]